MSSIPMLSIDRPAGDADWVEVAEPKTIVRRPMRAGNARIALAIANVRRDLRSSTPASAVFDDSTVRPIDSMDIESSSDADQRWDA